MAENEINKSPEIPEEEEYTLESILAEYKGNAYIAGERKLSKEDLEAQAAKIIEEMTRELSDPQSAVPTVQLRDDEGDDEEVTEYVPAEKKPLDKPETPAFDMERGAERYWMEVKGCTLERDGIGWFPDAPTERGVKHLRELIRAKDAGYEAVLAFVIQMDGVTEVRPNAATDPAFAGALREARDAGVEVWFLPCHVEPDLLGIKTATIS